MVAIGKARRCYSAGSMYIVIVIFGATHRVTVLQLTRKFQASIFCRVIAATDRQTDRQTDGQTHTHTRVTIQNK